jgi:DNA repair protein RecO (recombination protein O)
MLVKEKVFVLRKTKYGDADLILNCLTSTGARIGLYARSALKSKKRFGGGVLEPTHYIQVFYDDKSSSSSSESPLHTLKEAQLISDFPGIRTDYSRIELALYLVRAISEVVREGDLDSGELFNLLGNTLKAVETSARLSLLRLHFEVKLLANQGVLPVEREEAALLGLPISAHESIALTELEFSGLRARVRQVLSGYTSHLQERV